MDSTRWGLCKLVTGVLRSDTYSLGLKYSRNSFNVNCNQIINSATWRMSIIIIISTYNDCFHILIILYFLCDYRTENLKILLFLLKWFKLSFILKKLPWPKCCQHPKMAKFCNRYNLTIIKSLPPLTPRKESTNLSTMSAFGINARSASCNYDHTKRRLTILPNIDYSASNFIYWSKYWGQRSSVEWSIAFKQWIWYEGMYLVSTWNAIYFKYSIGTYRPNDAKRSWTGRQNYESISTHITGSANSSCYLNNFLSNFCSWH